LFDTDRSLYPRFSDIEISRRRDLVAEFIGARGLDGLVVFGWSASSRTAQADVYYLSGYMGMRDNYVVFSRQGESVLFAQSYNHVPNAGTVSFLDDVRWGGVDNGATVGAELLVRGVRRIGVVGWMPYQQYDSMRAAVGDACTFEDVTAGFRRLRLEKSEEEMEWLAKGAAFTDAALQGLADALEPGVREFELADAIEGSYLRQGGLTTMYYLASTPMSSPDRCVPSQVLSARRLEAGDAVTCEISAAYAGYAGQGLRTFTVAAEPTPQIAELHAVAEEVFHRVAGAIRPGSGIEELWEASDLIAEEGFTIRDGLVHGYGIGLLPPSLRTRQTTHDIDDDWVFGDNQTIVIQPNVITADETAGVQIGDLCVVTEDGARSLHQFPLELIRAG
jgi:Xaa-Pro aminopeptidase